MKYIKLSGKVMAKDAEEIKKLSPLTSAPYSYMWAKTDSLIISEIFTSRKTACSVKGSFTDLKYATKRQTLTSPTPQKAERRPWLFAR